MRLLVKKKYTNLSGGKWVTITKAGSPLHGRHVYISDDGTILAGKVPKEMHGKKLSEIHDDAPHKHMEHSHEDSSSKSKEDLQNDIKEAEAQIEHHKNSGASQHQAYWENKKAIAEHHYQLKSNEVEKRPIPDTAPYLSKKPIHNTYSKKSPAELKAIIAQAKTNIKENGGNAYDKKVIAVASYYLNGGQKPDDSMFGTKKQKAESESLSGGEKKEDVPEPKSQEQILDDMIASAPHLDVSIGYHKALASKNVGQLEELQDIEINAMKSAIESSNKDAADTKKAKIEMIQHYIKAKGGDVKDIPSIEEHDAEKQKLIDSAPHKGEYDNLIKYYSKMSSEQLDDAQHSIIEGMEEDAKLGDTEFVDHNKKALDIIHHFLGEDAQKISFNPKPFAPHKDKYPMTHANSETGDADKIKSVQETQIKKMQQNIDEGNEQFYGDAKNKLEIANYYASHHGHPTMEGPEFKKKLVAPHLDKEGFHNMFADKKAGTLKDAIKKFEDDLSQLNPSSLAAQLTQKKLDVAKYYLAGGEKPDFSSISVQQAHDKTLDDFHNKAHDVQTTDHPQHGQNLSSYGIDYTNPEHAHQWQTKIDHNSHGMSADQIKYTADKLTKLMYHGSEKFGKTSHDSSTAKANSQKHLLNRIFSGPQDELESFMRLTDEVCDYGKYSPDMPLEKKKERAREAIRNMVSSWASSSGDHNALSVAMQLAAKKEFGLNASYDKFQQSTMDNAHNKFLSKPEVEKGMRTFLRSMYNQTQQFFKENGITHIPVVRGMSFKDTGPVSHIPLNTPTKGKMTLQPLSSFSSNADTAEGFTGTVTGGAGIIRVMTAAMIPVERVMGNVQTGFGCMNEEEFIVLGGSNELDDTVTYVWDSHGAGKKGFHATDMFKYLADPKFNSKSPNNNFEIGNDQGHLPKLVQDMKTPKKSPMTKKPTKNYQIKSVFSSSGYKPAVNAKHVINSHGLDAFVHKVGNGYQVSDGTTGTKITGVYKTQAQAINTFHYILGDSPNQLKENLSKKPAIPDHMFKSMSGQDDVSRYTEDEELPILNVDEDLHNADWTKRSWDLPEIGSPEFDQFLKATGYTMEEFKQTPAYQHAKSKMKKSEDEKGYYPSDRLAYKTHTRDPIYIPVNRLSTPYQTDAAMDEDKIKDNVRKIKEGVAMSPVMIGYDHDVHDGHHRLEAAKRCGHSHVPCVVRGRNQRRTEAAEKRYRGMWKSETALLVKRDRRASDDVRLLVKNDKKDLPDGGKWITTHGSHIYIKDGKVLAGAEGGLHMSYVRINNTGKNKTKVQGTEYAQDIEPHGEYMSHDSMNGKSRIDLPNYEYGKIHFKNPLFIEHETTGHGGWKTKLSEKFGGKKGKALSNAIRKAGHDGIVTVDSKYGDINETVNLDGVKTPHDDVKKSIYVRKDLRKSDPAALQLMYHASVNPDLRFTGDRPIKNYNQIGSWFSSDPTKTFEFYGPNVYEIYANVENPLCAWTDDFDKFFYDPELAERFLKLGANKSNVTREDMTALMENPEYCSAFKDSIVQRGYDAIVWLDSTIDIPPERAGHEHHTVTILLHPEEQIKQQRLMDTSEVFARGNRPIIVKKSMASMLIGLFVKRDKE